MVDSGSAACYKGSMGSIGRAAGLALVITLLACSSKTAGETREPAAASPAAPASAPEQDAGAPDVPGPDVGRAELLPVDAAEETEPGTADIIEAGAAAEQAEASGGTNFVLYVSNQSFAVNPVDITVKIDGETIVSQDFDVGIQHTWVPFNLSLPSGKHTIQVKSKKGKASLKKTFEVKGMHWAVVGYWYYPKTHYMPTPKSFSFTLYDQPILFQ